MDAAFAWVFIAVFSWLAIVRFVFRYKTKDLTRPLINRAEGLGNILFRWFLGLVLFASISMYFLAPDKIAWAFFPVPTWARVMGAISSAIGVGIIWWSHAALDLAFSSTLRTTQEQRLVTSGPYRWVAHPMYSGFFLLFIGALFFTRSWVIGGAGLLVIGSLMTTRLAREERMLIEHFGGAYETYLGSVGRFVPKLWRSRG